jgi:hypothetical protein
MNFLQPLLRNKTAVIKNIIIILIVNVLLLEVLSPSSI